MRLTAKQTQAHRLALSGEKQFILFGGAIRGGKSWWMLLTFIALCSKYPKSRWVIIRKSLPVLKQNTFPTFQEIVNKGLAGHIKEWNHETHTVTFVNGSQLIFMSEAYDTDKELNRFKGLEINGAGIDEINECQEKTLDKLFERSGSWLHAQGKAPIIILATCNPSNNWVKKKVYEPWKENTLPTTWAYIPSKITDNPHLPQEYLESLRANMPPIDYAKFVEGDWDIVEKPENPFFYAYESDKHTSTDAVFNPEKNFIIAFDFNREPLAVTFQHVWRDQKGEHFHVFDELSVSNASIGKACDHIKAKYGDYLFNCEITGDSMGNRGDLGSREYASFYQQIREELRLRSNQFKVPGNPTHANSRVQCNKLLHGHPDLKINPKSCPNLTLDMAQLQCDATGQIIKSNRKVITERADHADCFRAVVNTYFHNWKKR
jgi:hypothetical protein